MFISEIAVLVLIEVIHLTKRKFPDITAINAA